MFYRSAAYTCCSLASQLLPAAVLLSMDYRPSSQILVKLHLLLVRPFNRKEFYTILPKRECLQTIADYGISLFLSQRIYPVHIADIDGDMVDGAITLRGVFSHLVSFDHDILQL